MQQRVIGDVEVSVIGLGAMPLSVDPAPDPDRAEATVHAALDAGVSVIDTADAYTPGSAGYAHGHNEEVVARALRTYERGDASVLVATKGGHVRDASVGWNTDGRPEYLRAACEASLRRLGVEAVGLYQHHRPDPDVPYEDTLGGLRALLDAGLVQRVGISNADPNQIRAAHEVIGDGLVSVQNRLSPEFRSSLAELEVCDELDLAFLPWSPLGGASRASTLGSEHHAFAEVAEELAVSPQQVCLAWLRGLSPRVIAIPGASRPESIRDSAASVDLELTTEQQAALDAA
jgi:aryl-alcohol dehydrogenase-like predicted oxidoreductase